MLRQPVTPAGAAQAVAVAAVYGGNVGAGLSVIVRAVPGLMLGRAGAGRGCA